MLGEPRHRHPVTVMSDDPQDSCSVTKGQGACTARRMWDEKVIHVLDRTGRDPVRFHHSTQMAHSLKLMNFFFPEFFYLIFLIRG